MMTYSTSYLLIMLGFIYFMVADHQGQVSLHCSHDLDLPFTRHSVRLIQVVASTYILQSRMAVPTPTDPVAGRLDSQSISLGSSTKLPATRNSFTKQFMFLDCAHFSAAQNWHPRESTLGTSPPPPLIWAGRLISAPLSLCIKIL